jgi:hypothetical protein
MGSKTIITGLFFLLILLSGFWLSRSGKPYSTLILTAHKLIGLTAGITLVVSVYRYHQTAPLSPAAISALITTILIFVGLMATGGLLSAAKTIPLAVSTMHKIFPYLAIISTGVTFHLIS